MESLRTNLPPISAHPKPSKGIMAEIGALLSQHGPLSLRGIRANLAGRHHEGDVIDTLDELRRLGLVAELSGGLYRFDSTAAAQRISEALTAEATAVRARIAAEQNAQHQAKDERVFSRIRAERML